MSKTTIKVTNPYGQEFEVSEDYYEAYKQNLTPVKKPRKASTAKTKVAEPVETKEASE
ncbi:TPA: hypothetical protein NJ626_000260 [Vibrio parahaemolyticus]|nr:hypothetical protein [Vibrio parahaemolyticus]